MNTLIVSLRHNLTSSHDNSIRYVLPNPKTIEKNGSYMLQFKMIVKMTYFQIGQVASYICVTGIIHEEMLASTLVFSHVQGSIDLFNWTIFCSQHDCEIRSQVHMSDNFCPNWMKYGQQLKIYIHNIQDFFIIKISLRI